MTGKKTPYRIYLPDDVIAALDAAAEQTGLQTGNQVASDVIIRCLPMWLAAQEAVGDTLNDYLRRIVADSKRGE